MSGPITTSGPLYGDIADGLTAAFNGAEARGVLTPQNASGPTSYYQTPTQTKFAAGLNTAKPNDSFLSFIGHVGSQVGHAVASIPSAVASETKSVWNASVNGIEDFGSANARLTSFNSQLDSNNEIRSNAMKAYYAGTFSKEHLNNTLRNLQKNDQDIGKQAKKVGQSVTTGQAIKLGTSLATLTLIPVSMLTGAGEAGLLGSASAEAAGLSTRVAIGDVVGGLTDQAATKISPYVPRLAQIVNDTGDMAANVLAKTPAILKTVNATPEAQSALKVGFNVLLRNPIEMGLAVQQPQLIYQAAASGKYGEAAFFAGTLGLGAFEGGPVGIAGKFFGPLKEAASSAIFGKAGFIDEIGQVLKDDPVKYLEDLQKSDPAQYVEAIKAWKTFESINLDHFQGDVKGAVNWVAQWHQMHSNPLSNFTSEELTKYWIDFKNTLGDIQQLGRDGKLSIEGEKITEDNLSRVGIGKFGTDEKLSLIDAFKQVSEKTGGNAAAQTARVQLAEQMINNGSGWAQNPNLRAAILHAVKAEPSTVEGVAKAGSEDATISSALDSQAGDATAPGLADQNAPAPSVDTGAPAPDVNAGPAPQANGTPSLAAPAEAGSADVQAGVQNAVDNPTLGAPETATAGEVTLPASGSEKLDNNWAKAIMKIQTGQEVTMTGDSIFPRNYFPIFLNPNAKGYDTKILESIDQLKAASSISDVLDRSVAPKAIAGSVGSFITNIGLSPKDQQAAAYIVLRRNVGDNLLDRGIEFGEKELDGARPADYMLDKLGQASDTKRAVFDLRQLSTKEIQSALTVDSKTAGAIRGAIRDAYVDIPLQLRGLGNKVQDINSKFNPLAAPYSRIQSAARYVYNPFFKAREIIKSEYAGQAEVGGKMIQLPGINAVANIFGRDKQAIEDTVIKLDKAGFFTGSGRDEFAGSGLVPISAHLRDNQKLTMAGMVTSLAKKANMTVDDYMKANAEELSKSLRITVQYPKNSWLNSPLATTLNLVAFPARFDLKVLSLTVKAMSKMTPMDQALLLNSTMQAGDWLNSDEGQTWQAKNAESLRVLKYFTPENVMSTVAGVLTGKVHAVSDLGELGGLPFGFIGQILQHEGILNQGAPFISQTSGQALPDYIPKTAKARAYGALTDLLSSLFSYPGATLGLQSKTSVVGDFAQKIIPVKTNDATQFDKVTPTLTPQEQHSAQLIQNARGLGAPANAPSIVPGAQNTTPPAASVKNPMAIYQVPPPSQMKPLVERQAPLDKSGRPATASQVKPAKGKRVYVASPP